MYTKATYFEQSDNFYKNNVGMTFGLCLSPEYHKSGLKNSCKNRKNFNFRNKKFLYFNVVHLRLRY